MCCLALRQPYYDATSSAGGSAKRPSIELTAVASGDLAAVLRRRQRSSELPPWLGDNSKSSRDGSLRLRDSSDAGHQTQS